MGRSEGGIIGAKSIRKIIETFWSEKPGLDDPATTSTSGSSSDLDLDLTVRAIVETRRTFSNNVP